MEKVLDCGSKEDRRASQQKFFECNTFEEFLLTWSKFYLNEVCIPTYYDVFTEAEDNPQANAELAQLFVDITLMDCIVTNSQVSIRNRQKAYVECFVPNDISQLLYVELNRYEGISAILNNSLGDDDDDDDGLNLPYVTYNNWNEEKGEIMGGVAYTRLSTDRSDLRIIRGWLNPGMRKRMSLTYLDKIIILDANTTSEAFKLVNILKECLNTIHWQNSIYHSIKEGHYSVLKKLLSAEVTVRSVDAQSSRYGRRGVSMIETAIRSQNIEIINLLLRYIKVLDVNLYQSGLERLLVKLNDEVVTQKVQSKLPEWYWKRTRQ